MDPPPAEDPPTTEVASPDDVVSVSIPEEETPYTLEKDSEEEVSKAAAMSDRLTATWATILALWFGLSKTTQVAIMAGAAVGTVGVIALVAAGGRAPAFPAHINVAFVGNSYFYVNDLPRVVEEMGGGHITQDSVIHTQANILQILMAGNGMYNKWATRSAMANGVAFETSEGNTAYLYDMGACSVPQLLTGVDETITAGNAMGSFIDDGENPCFQEDAYREYQAQKGLNHGWDYLVLSDMSKNMVFADTRELTLMAFNYTYAPLLKEKNISPIIVQPHAFATYESSGSELTDLVTFTEKIMDGAVIYKQYLNKRIGLFAQAHVAPVGNAFLAVYEESTDVWSKLFLDDGIHPSAHGTFLYGCIIYATMTGYMPSYKRVVVDDMENSVIFSTARRLQASESQAGYPTKDEADFLYKIAKKVALRGYTPSSVSGSGDASFLRSGGDNNQQYNDNSYNGNYNNGQDYVNDDQSAYSYMYGQENDEAGDYDYGDYEYQGYEDGDDDADAQEYDYDQDEQQDEDYEEEQEDADYEQQDYQEDAADDAEEEVADDSQASDNGYYEAANEYFQNSGSNNNNKQQAYEDHETQFYYSDLSGSNGSD